MKKVLSIILAMVMLFSMFSATSVVTLAADEALPVAVEEKADAGFFDGFLAFFSDIINSILDLFTFEKELPDVSEWTDEQIIDYYKKAARKIKYVKADREFVHKGVSITNITGPDDFVEQNDMNEQIQAIMPDMYEEMNSKPVKGVMGDYKNLTVADCKSIKAYTEGGYTVIELKLNNQHDSINDEEDKITLSHAMEDFGDISSRVSKIKVYGMTIKFPDLVCDYSNATAKIRINPRGVVEYGTWYYDVNTVAKNFGIEMSYPAVSVGCDMAWKTSCTMTIGGGF